MKILKNLVTPLSLVILVGTSAPAFASNGGSSNGNSGSLLTYITQVVNATVSAVANLIYELNPDMPLAISGNLGQVIAKQNSSSTLGKLTLTLVKNGLTPQTDSSALIQLAGIPASDSLYVPSSVWSLTGQKNSLNLTAGDNNFNFNSFFSPLAYTSNTKETYAENYLKFLGNQAQPLSTLDLSQLSQTQRKDLQANTDFQDYQIALRGLISQQSVAYGNFYHLLAERELQKNLGASIGMVNEKGKAVKDASTLQVEKYIATRRANSPEWYENISTASSTSLLREIAFELADMEKEQFQLHMDNERVLATLSTIELQTALNSVTSVQQAGQTIQSKIDQMTGQSGGSTTGSNTLNNGNS